MHKTYSISYLKSSERAVPFKHTKGLHRANSTMQPSSNRHQKYILTPTFIHAPGLGPDLKGVRFSLDGPVCWGVLGRQAWQGLRGGRGSDALAERGCQGRVHRRVCVGAPVAGNTMLGAVLTVLSCQLLLEKQINII